MSDYRNLDGAYESLPLGMPGRNMTTFKIDVGSARVVTFEERMEERLRSLERRVEKAESDVVWAHWVIVAVAVTLAIVT